MKKKINKKFIITDSSHILMDCKINNVEGIFIVDTGASHSCINHLVADKFNLCFEKYHDHASSATEKINETYFSKNNTLEIEQIQKKKFEIILFDMSHINNSLNRKKICEIDGIIGSDVLKECNAIINYENKTITLKL